MSITIRAAGPDDVATILRFVRELAEYERAADQVVATEALLGEALFGAHPAAEAVIAEMGGVAVGMALYFFNFSTWSGWRGLYLEDLYVTPEARGAGVGGALLRHLARLAVERDCARFEWAVLGWNAGAIAVYDRLGAASLDDWRIRRVSGAALADLARDG